jgi:tetratricopeptide (TPR) repeat protein
MAAMAALLTLVVGVAVNLGTSLPLPESWVWARNPAVVWTVVGVLALPLIALAALQQRLADGPGPGDRRPGPAQPAEPQPSSWADQGDAVAVRLWALPAHVFGRKDLLDRLEACRSEGGLAVLAGPGGTGKSTTARELVRRREQREVHSAQKLGRKKPLDVHWKRPPEWEVSAVTPASLIAGMVSVARDLGGDEDDLEVIAKGSPSGPDRLWRLLERGTKGWLLIVDNADDVTTLARPPLRQAEVTHAVREGTGWIRTSRRGLVLVTSRQRDERAWPSEALLLPVGVLSDADAAAVLIDEAGGGQDMDEAQRKKQFAEATALARRLGGLPLALRLAGRYLRSDYGQDSSFEAYRQRLDANPRAIEHLKYDPGDPEAGDRSTVMRTWELSLDALAENGLPEARPLLRLLSCYAPSVPVPISLLRPTVVVPFFREAVKASEGTKGRGGASVDQVLRGLDRLGLIDRNEVLDVQRSNGSLQRPLPASAAVLHPVIADTNRVHLLEPGPDDPPELLVRHTAVAVLAVEVDSLGYDDPAARPAFQSLTSHIQAMVANSAPRLGDDDLLELTRATCSTALSYEQMGTPEVGLYLPGPILAETRRRGLELSDTLSWAWQQQAHLFAAAKQYDEAESIYLEILTDQLHRWPEDDPGNLVIRHGLARLAAAQGRVEEARAALHDVLEQERRVLGDDHLCTLAVRSDLAALLAQKGQWDEAGIALRELLADAVRALGEDATFTLCTRHNVAVVMRHQGGRRAAGAAIRELLGDERRLLGDEHQVTTATRQLGDEHHITMATRQLDAKDFLYCSLLGTPEVREQLAIDLFNEGVDMAKSDRRADAVRTYGDVIERFAADSSPRLREIAANAYLNLGQVLGLGEAGDRARAATTYEEMDEQFGGDPEPMLRIMSSEGLTRLAVARHHRGDLTGALHAAARAQRRYREVAETGYEFHRRDLIRAERLFEEISRETAVRLLRHGEAMAARGRHEDAVAAYDELLARFGDDPLPVLQEAVATAKTQRAISSSLCR